MAPISYFLPNKTLLHRFQVAFMNSHDLLPPKGSTTLHQEALLVFWISLIIYLAYNYISKRVPTRYGEVTEVLGKEARCYQKEKVVIVEPNCDGPCRQQQSSVSKEKALLSAFTIGWIMVFFYLCDYLHFLPKAERIYSRDVFVFLSIVLVIVAVGFTARQTDDAKLLNRHQTEEWKGWMQVMFVWYHYFKAAETYNAVRVYIAAYVWMTGFGNFSFFWVRRDYSIRRVMKMLFRLNFLVTLTMLVVDNPYMLYYICAMHTFWFLSVYAMMRPLEAWNESRKVMLIKFCIYLVVVFLLFDVPGVALIVFSPLEFLLGYQNSMHEWIFRSGLDHYATLLGMLCAYNHPNAERLLAYINGHRLKNVFLTALGVFIASVFCIWHEMVFIKSKHEYNRLHPYTSFIPILTYIAVRNSTSWLRGRHVALFTFLGKITLETYISQLHIYLQADAKYLLVYIADYPLLNFVLNSFIYLYISNLLFETTVTINEFLFAKDAHSMIRNMTALAVWLLCSYAAAALLRHL